jgi:DNA repair exonuclease SbcCD nuclease subunit
MKMAISKARELDVPVIVAGDLHDTKANLRAECVNTLLNTFSGIRYDPIILVGNHDKINEKSEDHALHFLDKYFTIKSPQKLELPEGDKLYAIPYHSDPDLLREYLKTIPKGSLLIMHQGLKSANSGEYGDHDKSAITYEDVQDFRVISGHYHTRQDIKTGRPQKGAVGLFSYIGNPYTLTFGEANDPPKGFQVLYDDGSLEFIPTNLRKHVVFNMTCSEIVPQTVLTYNPEDLLWLKITGTKEELVKLDRQSVIARMNVNAAQIRIDFIPQKVNINIDDSAKSRNGGQMADIMDELIIEHSASSNEQKLRLKELWRSKV